MPRIKDHRDVAVNTLITSQPRRKWAQFTVHFDSAAELERSSVIRTVVAETTSDTSDHEVRIVDNAGRAVGNVSWKRTIVCNSHPSQPTLREIVDDWYPRGQGMLMLTLPSRAPDRDAIWDDKPEVTCTLQMWVDAAQGFSATISAGDDPPYAIDFRETTTGTIHSFTLDARLELVSFVPSRTSESLRNVARQQPL